jgi:hypothetical protein
VACLSPILDHDRVDEHRRIDLLERSVEPVGHLGHHGVGDLGDGLLGYPGAIDLREVG